MKSLPRDAPWSLSDIRAAFLTAATACSALVAAWWGCSGTIRQNEQVGWTVLGVAGIILIGVGSFFWLLAGKWAVSARRDELLERVDRVRAHPARAGTLMADSGDLVIVPAMARYHRSTCLLVRGKAVRAASSSMRRRLRPCEMCRP